MRPEIRSYLHEVHAHLNLAPQTERRVLAELYSHLREKVSELELTGRPEQESVHEALASFGSARLVARLTYEAFSRGSWVEALICAQPHLIATALLHLPVIRWFVRADVDDRALDRRAPFCSQACAMADRLGGGVDPVPQLADRFTEWLATRPEKTATWETRWHPAGKRVKPNKR